MSSFRFMRRQPKLGTALHPRKGTSAISNHEYYWKMYGFNDAKKGMDKSR
jgi:hypothetical protein